MERIIGPVNGFYVAAYAWPLPGQERYCSYAKVCRDRPESYWEADAIFKLFGGERHSCAEEAISGAARAAREQIDHLPPLECSTFGLGMPYFEAAAR
ncbi:MAG: hypothetical protein HYX47_21710 [Burkholderiales bacterium]|nr:hypothetical protein [Burkholderiales bacterium]